TKEDAHDYRYFPDPDLPPLVIAPEWIEQVRANMPELPDARGARFVEEYGVTPYDASQLTLSRAIADYFEATARAVPEGQGKLAANWVMGEVAATLNREERDIADCPVTPAALAQLIARISDGTISNKLARTVFSAQWAGENGGDVDAIIEAKGLKQISDTGAIGTMIDEVMPANPAIVAEYRAGRERAFNALVGQVMKAAKGKANPQQVNQLLREKLDQAG